MNLEKYESDSVAHFDDHEDSAFCVDVLQSPDGVNNFFVSGDGKDKCYIWNL